MSCVVAPLLIKGNGFIAARRAINIAESEVLVIRSLGRQKLLEAVDLSATGRAD